MDTLLVMRMLRVEDFPFFGDFMKRNVHALLLSVPFLFAACAPTGELDGDATANGANDLRAPKGSDLMPAEGKPLIRTAQIRISAEKQTAFVDLRFIDRTIQEQSFGIGLLYSDNCPSSLGGVWGTAEHFNGFSTPGYGQVVGTKSPTFLFSKWTDGDGNVWQTYGYTAMVDPECEIRAVVQPSNCGLQLGGGDGGDVICEDLYGENYLSEPVLLERVYLD